MVMFEKKQEKQKSPIEGVVSAYKTGGMPLALLVSALTILLIGLTDAGVKAIDFNYESFILVGGLLAVLSVICFVVESVIRAKIKLALILVLQEMVKGASAASRDGAHYQTALRDVNSSYRLFLKTLAAPCGTLNEEEE